MAREAFGSTWMWVSELVVETHAQLEADHITVLGAVDFRNAKNSDKLDRYSSSK